MKAIEVAVIPSNLLFLCCSVNFSQVADQETHFVYKCIVFLLAMNFRAVVTTVVHDTGEVKK